MTFEQLRVLEAITKEGTFHGAALVLHKSQPAVSLMLKKLEEEIGLQLFSREEYRPKLTPSGEIFYRESTQVLHRMRQLDSLAKSLNSRQETEVCLVVSATCELAPFLRVAGQIKQDYPTTHIRLSTESMGGPIERLIKGDADLIVAAMDDVPVEVVEAVPFDTVEIIPVSHPHYPPAQLAHVKSIGEMQSYVQIIVADSSRGNNSQSRDVLTGGRRWTVSDFAAKREIILSGLGWGGLPNHLIAEDLVRGRLVKLDVEGFPERHSQLFQIRRRDRIAGAVSQAIWQHIMEIKNLPKATEQTFQT